MHWKIEKTETLLERPYLSVISEHCLLPTGERLEWDTALLRDWVMVVAYTASRELVIERQYRQPVREEMIELPAGNIDDGEEPEAAARREFAEETGYQLEDLQCLGAWPVLAGKTPCRCHVYLGRVSGEKGPTKFDTGEHLSVEICPAVAVLEMIRSGELNSAPYIAALLMVKDILPELFEQR